MLPVVFIKRYYSAEFAGYFDLTKLILSVPLALIASSFSSVVLNKTSECYREKKGYFKEIKPLIGIVVLISAIELVVILFWSESLFTFIFGSKWKFSGSLAKILVFPFALNFLTSSFTSLFVALNKIVWQSIWQIFYFALILVLPLLSGLKFENFIFAYSAIEVIANSSMVVLLILLIKKTNGKN
jgi:O-antigen/teichoic acid export membrane protein